jgi:hypothetical protein
MIGVPGAGRELPVEAVHARRFEKARSAQAARSSRIMSN